MNTDLYVGVMKQYTLEDLAHDNVWRFREAVPPVIGEHVRISPETYLLFGVLMRLSEKGFLTYQSQPACTQTIDEEVEAIVEQRAYVHGYVSLEKAAWIEQACGDKLLCYVTPVADLSATPGDYTTAKRVVEDGEFLSATFHAPTRGLHESNVYSATDRAKTDIEKAAAVTVIDPVWGRDWYLWDTLIHALA